MKNYSRCWQASKFLSYFEMIEQEDLKMYSLSEVTNCQHYLGPSSFLYREHVSQCVVLG